MLHRWQGGGIGVIDAGRVAKPARTLAQRSNWVEQAPIGGGRNVENDGVGM